MASDVICTMMPSSMMLDFARNPDTGFSAPLKTMKQAPVTGMKSIESRHGALYGVHDGG